MTVIIDKLQNLVKLKLPDTDQIQFVKLLELRSMPNLKYLYVHVEMDLADLFEHFPLDESLPLNVDEQIEELKMETPLIKALIKNLPNLKINEGRLEIATPNSTFPSRDDSLWEIQCKPTGDFLEHDFYNSYMYQ